MTSAWERISARAWLFYLVDLGLVEAGRCRDEIEVPDAVAADFHTAVTAARGLALQRLSPDLDTQDFRFVLSYISGLFGQASFCEVLFNLDCISEACPNCGEWVYPEDLQQLCRLPNPADEQPASNRAPGR